MTQTVYSRPVAVADSAFGKHVEGVRAGVATVRNFDRDNAAKRLPNFAENGLRNGQGKVREVD
jgi:hypothetical protein